MLSQGARREFAAHHRPRRGLSLVELLVGATVGLFIAGGALSLFASNVTGSRQLLAEARLNQDLRAAVDLLTRDLRRAGYWGNAIQGTIAVGATAATAQNPYSTLVSPSASEVKYDFSTDLAENNVLNSAEQFGVKLIDGKLQLHTDSGSTPTDMTDAKSVTITGFTITPVNQVLPLGQFCVKTCAAGTPNCPSVTVRKFDIVVQGRSVSDSSVQRSLRSSVRVRNDRLSGSCPV